MQMRARAGAISLAALGALCVLARLRPDGFTAGDPSDPTGAVVSVAAWLAWALTGYLLLAVAITATGHLCAGPAAGRARGRGEHFARRVSPRTVRRFVDAAVGAGAVVVVTTAGPVAAYADGGAPPAPPGVSRPAAAAPLDWPGLDRPAHDHAGLGARSPAPTTRPHLTPPPATAALVTSPARRGGGPREEIVVRAGDSLWTLTARRLGPGASAAEVAATWPRLYAANRGVIGADPGLIHPGQRLVPPAPDTRSPR